MTTTKTNRLRLLPVDPTMRRRYLNAVRRCEACEAAVRQGRFLQTAEVAAWRNAERIVREMSA